MIIVVVVLYCLKTQSEMRVIEIDNYNCNFQLHNYVIKSFSNYILNYFSLKPLLYILSSNLHIFLLLGNIIKNTITMQYYIIFSRGNKLINYYVH